MIPPTGVIKVVTPEGRIVRTLRDETGSSIAYITEGHRVNNYIYIGSVINPFLARVPASLLSSPRYCRLDD